MGEEEEGETKDTVVGDVHVLCVYLLLPFCTIKRILLMVIPMFCFYYLAFA